MKTLSDNWSIVTKKCASAESLCNQFKNMGFERHNKLKIEIKSIEVPGNIIGRLFRG